MRERGERRPSACRARRAAAPFDELRAPSRDCRGAALASGIAALAGSVIVLSSAVPSFAGDKDLKDLLEGVTRIAAPGVPGPLCVFGREAFPVVVGGAGKELRAPVVAAARMGRGRVVAFGHTGYLDPGALAKEATGRLMANAVRWVSARARAAGRKPRVAAHRKGGLVQFLKGKGFNARALDGGDWWRKLGSCDVFCSGQSVFGTSDGLDAVRDFVTRGGGLIVTDCPWGWLQLNRGKTLLADHPGNRLLASAGIVFADGYMKRTHDIGYDAKAVPSRLTHAGRALEALLAHSTGKKKLAAGESAQAAWTVTTAARSLPPGDTLLLPRIRGLKRGRSVPTVPTHAKPITTRQPLARVLLTLEMQELAGQPVEDVRPHPAAAEFPGKVPPDAERVTRTVGIDTRVPGWHSTGLYAAAGEVVEVAVHKRAVGSRLQVRIGAHRDKVWGHDKWRRCPEITRSFRVEGQLTRAACAFGGLVYVEVPKGCKLGEIEAIVKGAVEAPYYVHGKTTLLEWRERVRLLPAPWAELASTRAILTVPSKHVRELDDPKALMAFWDRVLDACAELAARPLERARPERYVADEQISAGYMHAGYPIMTHLDAAARMVDLALLTGKGDWGLYHETGHNHQSGEWTFGGTGEVTVNLFTLYVYDKVCGKDPAEARPRTFAKAAMKRKIAAHFASGADFGRWKSDPFLALITYVQLQQEFGWDAYRKVFAEYRSLPRSERPRNDDQKRDQWMVRFSRTVGRHLGPFFEAWNVPTSAKARESISDLPRWMPEGFPPASP